MFCQKCGKQAAEGTRFCEACGAPLEAAPAVEAPVVEAPVAEAPVAEMPAEEAPKADFAAKAKGLADVALAKCKEGLAFVMKLPKKILAIGAAAVALVLVVAIVLGIVLSGGGAKVPSYALYVKGGDLYYNPDSSVKPWRVTKDPASTNVQMSADGKRIFFMEQDGSDTELHYAAVGKEKDSVKIEDGISQWQINEKGTKVLFTKGGDLYSHNLKEKEKIASDVDGFVVSEDFGTILYSVEEDGESEVYVKKGKKDAEKILDGEDIELCAYDRSMSTIWFVEDDDLYEQKIGKKKEKLIGDVGSVIRIYDSGDVLYTKDGEDKKIPLANYVNDDLKDADAKAVEPVKPTQPTYPEYPEYPSYPYSWEYESDAAYQAALDAYNTKREQLTNEYNAAKEKYQKDYEQYQKDLSAYYDAKDEYDDIADRNELREELKTQNFEYTTKKLCYFDGKKETVLTEDYTSFEDYAADKAVIVYGARKVDDSKKIKMSEVDYIYDVESFARENVSAALYVGVEGKTSELKNEEAFSVRLTDDGKTVYFLDKKDEEKGEAELYKAAIGKEVKKVEKIDSDVTADSLSLEEDKPVYTKAKKDEHYDLYWDGKKIDSDVYRHGYYEARGGFVYRTDYKDGEFTLKTSNGKKAVKVADDVQNYSVLPNGNITYLKDYNMAKGKGDMYLYKGSKSVLVDDGVSTLVTVFGAQYSDKEYKIINV